VRKPSRGPCAAAVTVPLEPAKLRRVIAHIRSNLDQELDVESLAKLAGASASCFARAFLQQVGVTPHAYVLDQRVERAKALLEGTDLSLAEVALAVGFTSQSCLNVAFRGRAGTTPGRFRAKFSRKAKDAPRRRV